MTALMAVVAVIGWWYGPRVWDSVQFHYLYQRCATFELDKETIAYSEHPTDRASLATVSGYDSSGGNPRTRTPESVGLHDPACFRRLADFCGIVSGFIKGITQVRGERKCLFVHELRSSLGVRRLLVLHYTQNGGVFDSSVPRVPSRYEYYLFDPERLTSSRGHTSWENREEYLDAAPYFPIDPTPTTYRADWHIYSSSRPPLRIFAGQADPIDASRFTIDYEAGGKRHRLIGNLNPDGNSIELRD
jgi:hypothetical protein